MTFSILFWNIWLDNQLHGKKGATHLLFELDRLANQYQPDFIGLNEVLKYKHDDIPFVLEFLKDQLGYAHNHYTTLSAHDDNWFDGAAFCSRDKIDSIKEFPLSKNSYATRRGYEGFNLQAMAAHLQLTTRHDLGIIVTHAMPLIPATTDILGDHYRGTHKLSQLIHSQEYSRNTILIGDMNEPRLMPRSLRGKLADVMHTETGSFFNPTWRHNAHRLTPLRCNLDYVYWSKDSDFYLKDFKVLSSNVSDHRPLLATFALKAQDE